MRESGMTYYSNEVHQEIVKQYLLLRNAKEVGKLLGVCSETVKRWAREAGIKTNDRSFSRKCRKDIPGKAESFDFKEIELGYLCGLIAADGCLSYNSKVISIELQVRDKAVLDWMLTKVSTENFLLPAARQRKIGVPTVKLSRTLPKLYDYLMDMGITPRKSLTLDVSLEGKSDEFKWYFLRGLIDGDGCVQVLRTLADCSIRVISGSPLFIRQLQSIFGGTITKSGTVEMLQFKGALAKQLAFKLPIDSWTMERKTLKIQELISKPAQALRKTSILVGSIWGVYKPPLCWIEEYKNSGSTVNINTVKYRLRNGWTNNEAFFTPAREKRT